MVFSLTLIQMCSKDSTEPQISDEPIDATGSWELTTTITANTFGFPNGETNTEVIYLSDSSGVLSIVNFDGHWGSYSVTGRNISFTGSEVSDDFPSTATLATAGSGTGTESEISGSLVTEVDMTNPVSSQNPDGTINSDFLMIKLAETTCYDRASFGDPATSPYICPFQWGRPIRYTRAIAGGSVDTGINWPMIL